MKARFKDGPPVSSAWRGLEVDIRPRSRIDQHTLIVAVVDPRATEDQRRQLIYASLSNFEPLDAEAAELLAALRAANKLGGRM